MQAHHLPDHPQDETPAPHPVAASAAPAPIDAAWPLTIGAVLLGLALILLLFHDTVADIVGLWAIDSAYNHGFLIIPISLYLIWERQATIAPIRPRPNIWGVAIIAPFGLLWLVSDVADIDMASQYAVVGIIQGFLFTLLGWPAFRSMLFPLCYLWLLVPAGSSMLPSLQSLAASLTTEGIRLIGIPIFAEGLYLTVPTGIYRIAPGCAGLNFLLSGFAIALLYGNLIYRGWIKRTATVVATLVIALLANAIRIIGIIWIAHIAGQYIDIAADHLLYGWGFFGIIIAVMMWYGLRYRDPDADEEPVAARPGLDPARTARLTATLIAAVAVATVAPTYAVYTGSAPPLAPVVSLALPASTGPWREDPTGSTWHAKFPGAGAQVQRTYALENTRVDLFIAYYWRQGEGHELVGWGNKIADDETWQQLGSRAGRVRIDGARHDVGVAQLSSGNRRRHVWHWYWVDGRYTASAMVAKLLQIKSELLRGERRSAFIAVSTEPEIEAAAAEAAVQDLLDALSPMSRILTSAALAPDQNR
jgi:exosortase A